MDATENDETITLSRTTSPESKDDTEVIKSDFQNEKPEGHANVVEFEDEIDDEPERGGWGKHIQFILTCIGYAVGLGNVWRFPYLVYKHGGGSFFVPYFLMLTFLGAPVFLLEISLGQFSAQGPVTCWTFAPIFRGVGFAGVWVTFLVTIYYQLILAWSLYYLFRSFSLDLPWSKCRDPWMSSKCRNLKSICINLEFPTKDCVPCGYWQNKTDGTCRDKNDSNTTLNLVAENIKGHIGLSHDKDPKTLLSGYEYFNNHVTGTKDELSGIGGIQWHLFICLLLCWIMIALCLSQGIKSVGKSAYFMSLSPYFFLTILLINGVIKDGASDGIIYYIKPVPSKLVNPQVWVDAAIQIFFSLSAAMGGLIALSSYNKFHANILRDSAIVIVGNSSTSIFAGFVVFSYIGYIAKEQGVPIEEFAKGGPSLVFGVYPMAITLMAVPQLWSVTFFLMLMALGCNTNLVNTETVITSLKDMFPQLRIYKTRLAFGMCGMFFLLGVPMTLETGYKLFEVFDTYSSGWNSLLVAFFEFIALAHVYGAKRFLRDIACMLGKDNTLFKIPFEYWRNYFYLCWSYISPIAAATLVIVSWVNYKTDDKNIFLKLFGWVLTMTSVCSIFGYMIYAIKTTPGTIKERLKILTTPLPRWGPRLKDDRMLVAEYTPGFVVNLESRRHSSTTHKSILPWSSRHSSATRKSNLPRSELEMNEDAKSGTSRDTKFGTSRDAKSGTSRDTSLKVPSENGSQQKSTSIW